jgi:hypothetical protein
MQLLSCSHCGASVLAAVGNLVAAQDPSGYRARPVRATVPFIYTTTKIPYTYTRTSRRSGSPGKSLCFSRFAEQYAERLEEVDLNPMIVRAQGPSIVDTRIVQRPQVKEKT